MSKHHVSARNDGAARLARFMPGLAAPLLVRQPEHVRWLTGFTGSYGLVVADARGATFITDRRYAEQVRHEVRPPFEVVLQTKRLADAILATGRVPRPARGAALSRGAPAPCLEVEAEAVTCAELERLRRDLPGIELVPVPSPLLAPRRSKDAGEVARIEAALRLTEAAMVYAVASMRPGMTEVEVAALLERFARVRGASGPAFQTIVAAGERSALPHGVASTRPIGRDELVLFDFGFILDGYCSDFTRVVWTGKRPPSRVRRMHELVREAQSIGLGALAAGGPCADADRAVRAFFKDNKVLARYEHSLGHGVGLAIHEAPRLSWQSTETLAEGDVVTVEPGLYYPGFGGIRLEDMAVVGRRGARTLTDFPLALACLGW